MIDQGQSQSQLPQERLSATEIGLRTRRAEPATDHYMLSKDHSQGSQEHGTIKHCLKYLTFVNGCLK